MKTNRVLLGVLGGVAAGALLGVLFAPDRGSETRKKIAQKKDEFTGAVKEKVNSFVEGVSSAFGSVTDQADELLAAGREKVEDVKDRAENLKGRAEDNLKRAEDHLKREVKAS